MSRDESNTLGWSWVCISLEFERLRQEDYQDFEGSLGLMRPCLKKTQTDWPKKLLTDNEA